MIKRIKKIFDNKPSPLLWLILAVATSITTYSNYRNDKLIMASLGLVITIACFVPYLRERKKKNDDK